MAKIIEVTDLSQPELDVYVRLTDAQLRNRLEPEKGIFIAESPKVIGRALDAGCEPVSLLMERRHLAGQGKAVMERCGDIPVYTGEREILEALTGYQLTRGILCAMKRPRLSTMEELCDGMYRLAVLENITDATNVGAIFRSAAALGMDCVLTTPSCCDPLCRRAVRVSMGAVLQIPWTVIGNSADDWPENGLKRLNHMGFKTAAMALREDAVPVDDPALGCERQLAVIFGTEGEGLAPGTIAQCDYTVRIPMSRGVDSLNVAAASAVAFWQLRRQID